MGFGIYATCRSGPRACWPMPERTLARREALQAFDAAGAFLRGHFVYTSGRHGADYLEKFRILEDPKTTTALAAMIANEFSPLTPELVAGPTTGGIILAYEVARQLGVNAVYVERGEPGGRTLRRGFETPPVARVQEGAAAGARCNCSRISRRRLWRPTAGSVCRTGAVVGLAAGRTASSVEAPRAARRTWRSRTVQDTLPKSHGLKLGSVSGW